MKQMFIQCLLTKLTDKGCLKTISWLPEQFAEPRRVLKLKNEDGSWTDGWVVQETYGSNTQEFVLSHERDFAKQRQASDI